MAYGSTDILNEESERGDSLLFLLMPFMDECRKSMVPVSSILQGQKFISTDFYIYKIGQDVVRLDDGTIASTSGSLKFAPSEMVWLMEARGK